MAGLDYLSVVSTEDGAENYERIAMSVLQDHNLLSIIRGLNIYIDPGYPLFVAVGLIRPPTNKITVSDVGNVLIQGGKAIISVGDEKYLSHMLKVFWEKFGHDNVDQPDRYTVIIKNVEIPEDISGWIVANPAEALFKDLIYAIQVIAPEGFKVRRENYGKDRFSYAASENTLPENDVNVIIEERFKIMEDEMR